MKPVPLRELWRGEASHFTPWLAEDDNLALLGETLGLRLELRAVEKQIGSFIADIVAEDVERNTTVLIENQLEPTDHRHLGQVLTYAAGLNAETIIWISQSVREEHRAAIDWLNEITGTHFRFFAIEIQAWTISGATAAPQFHVVSKPNDWSKRAFSSTETQSQDLTESQRQWRAFWQGLIEFGGGELPALAARTAYKGNWQTVEGRRMAPTAYVEFNVSSHRDGLRVEAYLGGAHAKLVFRELKARQAEIEQEFGGPLQWEELPAGQDSRVALYKGAEPAARAGDASQRTAQYAWATKNLGKIITAISPVLEQIDWPSVIADGGED
tara:strand:- start:1648 stop:2628 length:981 start_codon:yes stop_codon:yes gene_type:complete